MSEQSAGPYVTLAESNSEAPYAIDRDMRVWAVVRDGGMLTRADYNGITSCGITWAEQHLGPLIPFDPAYALASETARPKVAVRAEDLVELLEFYASGALTQPTLAAYGRLREALNTQGSGGAA